MNQLKQVERLEEGNVFLDDKQLAIYLKLPDEISEELFMDKNPIGFKRCSKCRKVLKWYLFNKNRASKNNCSGQCKECQKIGAKESYDKLKDTRDSKQYYLNNIEKRREASRRYYEKNKESIRIKHRKYKQSQTGRENSNKAHNKRHGLAAQNKGIPYKRQMVIDRDTNLEGKPVCCLCLKPIDNLKDLHMEHLIPLTLGGYDCFTNVGCAHSACNLQKSKDAHEITAEQVKRLQELAHTYMDENPELFASFFND